MLNLTEDERKLAEIFMPDTMRRTEQFFQKNGRFAHYTSAETAFKIIKSKRVWMRNAITMNDFSEVAYGEHCLFPAYKDENIGGRWRSFLNGMHEGFSQELEALFNGWLPHFKNNTYLTSLSEHEDYEDVYGRLSMWRAYAPKNGVAIVVNHQPFAVATDRLGANSSPVTYFTQEQYREYLNGIVDRTIENATFIRALPREQLISVIFNYLKFSLLCTKHPGFKEEREWRIIYSPTITKSSVIEEDFEIVGGVPQEIHKIPLENNEENGLIGADIVQLVDKIIVGPSEEAYTIWCSFVKLLGQAGVAEADKKVIISDIPLRTF